MKRTDLAASSVEQQTGMRSVGSSRESELQSRAVDRQIRPIWVVYVARQVGSSLHSESSAYEAIYYRCVSIGQRDGQAIDRLII